MNVNAVKPVRLRVNGLRKSFSGVTVLHDVSFEAKAGCVLGIVGENGSGKSTTMNVLSGVLSKDSGLVLLDGIPFEPSSRRDADAAGIAFIQQELNIFANLTVAENLFLTRPRFRFARIPLVSRRRMHAEARELLRKVHLEIAPDALASTLSPGERQLVEIARGLASKACVFILDEPTSSLTSRESDRLFEIVHRLQQQDVAILYISHNLEEVLKLSDSVVVMRDGVVTLRAPTVGLTPRDLVLAMVGRSIDTLFPERSRTLPNAKPLLEVERLSEAGVLEDVSLCVRSGEIVGLAGLMGSGRTELARALFGLDRHRTGTVRVEGRALRSGDVKGRLAAGVAFLTEDRRQEGLMLEASVADNLALAALPQFVSRLAKRVRTARLLEEMRVIGERTNLKCQNMCTTVVRTLSGGNQQKVVLGRWLLRRPRVFILDEPTRGVDVGAKEEIYRLLAQLAQTGTAIVVISSELEELVGLCHRILVMRRGALRAEFDCAQFDREAILRAAFGQADAA
jgi:ABC-type sugar transport system ATPase subunit